MVDLNGEGAIMTSPLQGTSDNVWRHFWLLQEGEGGTGSCATDIYRVEAKDIVNHLFKMCHCLCCVFIAMHGGAWWAAVYGVAQSRTQLK